MKPGRFRLGGSCAEDKEELKGENDTLVGCRESICAWDQFCPCAICIFKRKVDAAVNSLHSPYHETAFGL